jgi:predicted transcriptional regulator
MNLRRRKSRRARAADKLRDLTGRRRKSKPARITDSVRDKVKRSGPAKTVQGAGMAGQAAGRSAKAMGAYADRKVAGKRAPLLVSLPFLAGASVTSFLAVRKMRRGVKQTLPD